MKRFYSITTKGFYIEGINKNIPIDAIEISKEQHEGLLNEQSQGKDIKIKDGLLITVLKPPLTKGELALMEISRLEAQITKRREREAILGTDNGWLANQDALIAIERDKLK